MRIARVLLLSATMLSAVPAFAQDSSAATDDGDRILVTADYLRSGSSTKTDTPAIQVPQPVTIISDDLFNAQGAISVSDTLNYVAGVQANPYGPDSRVDGAIIRGVNALQFRDGMRDIFSYYASIRSDPYNFDSVQVLRGPSSVLFGAGSTGGIINMNSKLPQFTESGEVLLRYGSFNRFEAMADYTGPISDDVAFRVVARARDADTQTDHVPDDRVLFAPSLTWAPDMDTSITFLGMYQEDDGGSTAQFLPLVGTILPNPNGQLPNNLFIGKPGWDRYDGRLLEGTILVEHRVSDAFKINSRARYIDSDLTYFTHYPDSYSNPANPFVQLDANGAPVFDVNGVPVPDPEQRTIGLYSDGSVARMEIFTSDNNAQFNFNTGAQVEHLVLAGVDFSWNHVRKVGGYGYEYIDIYDIDYDAISDHNGGLPQPSGPAEDVEQQQIGFYLQDQVRMWDRVSLVLGARYDDVWSTTFSGPRVKDNALTLRAGIIGDVIKGVSPFFSYTESFEPIAGTASNGEAFIPQRGKQFELGVKLQPNEASMITLTAYHIKETNRPISDDSTADPFDQIQAGEMTSKGFEFEASTVLPGNFQVIANYSYNDATLDGSDVQLDDVPKHNASLWLSRPFNLTHDATLTLGGGARYQGAHTSYGFAFPDGIRTPDNLLFDAYASIDWLKWSFSLNATNLTGKDYYSACLARGDCFVGAARNVFATVGYHF
ncbi:TonB-dependent siderophore receptor [Croceibacterium sp. LX-88]|uniref:TonB-dependent siderophore receptor n=1 Tax=Croceibacterium selenioxidans TaxID=2838833 RepID=A0ABS5VZL5_9SPHN|nr:TonB-dependent siderophore receptor [Croceibacterium selenioxidans]MBT2132968.1 TonB-dependent siderophore receptor [Croceibacterium selenioxidans]